MISRFNVYAIGVALALGAWGYIQTERLEDSRADLQAAQSINKAIVSARLEEQKLAESASHGAATAYAQLEELRNENRRLLDARAAGTVELRVQADCPAVPETTEARVVDNGSGPRLTQRAERHYHALRDKIATVTQQLSACQDYVRRVTGQEAN